MKNILKKGDKVKYEGDEYVVTFVFDHGGNMVYYDLEEENDSLGIWYKRIQLSVHYSELDGTN